MAGFGLIAVGLGLLAAWAVASPGAVSYFVTPEELAVGDGRTGSVRLGGRVAAGSMHRDGSLVTFSVTDGRATFPVRFRGEIPDTLKEGTDVVAEGRVSAQDVLVADRVLAKCSSKFVPESEAAARRKATARG